MENNKKIAIMTWHTYDNYGSVLQAYATQSVISNNTDFIPELIDYLPKTKKEKLLKRFKIKNVLFKIFNNSEKVKECMKEHKEKFDDFRRKNFNYSKKCNNASDLFLLNDEYQKFICGSDQIWAPTVFDENYFLSFVEDNSKKISYAPSIGMSSIKNDEIRKNMASLISKFECLSIREEQGKEIIRNICDKEAQVVLDPTLLLSKSEWNKKFKLDSFNIEKGSYILCYFLGEQSKYYKIANILAKKYNKKIILIPGKYKDYTKKKYDVSNPSPEEFLKLIYNAYIVITDSFHGTIFSINFNVPFISLKRFKDNSSSQNSRIYNILKKMNLENRLYNDNLKYYLKNIEIDFKESNLILDNQRKNSINYLLESIKKENKKNKEFRITNLCVGCGMCVSVCPKNCITIKKNSEGFFNYSIDFNKCIGCGNCKRVCGQLNYDIPSIKTSKLYSAYSNDENVLKNSSSGGIAYEISNMFLEDKKKVVACAYDKEKNIAKHIVVSDVEELKKVSGSKYLQSYSADAFKELKNIEEGVVIGTPCQIGSADKYLKLNNKRDKFILVDLICHGVPTYKLWDKFIKSYDRVDEVKFRDKQKGWRKKTMCINKKYYIDENKNKFYDFFCLGNIYGKHCYECKYRTSYCSDIRVGDFWGEKFKNNKNGVSMVLVNTKKGEEVLNKLVEAGRVNAKLENIEDYYKSQQVVNGSIPKDRTKIINDLENENISLKNISNKYCKEDMREEKIMRFLIKIYSKVKRSKNG